MYKAPFFVHAVFVFFNPSQKAQPPAVLAPWIPDLRRE